MQVRQQPLRSEEETQEEASLSITTKPTDHPKEDQALEQQQEQPTSNDDEAKDSVQAFALPEDSSTFLIVLLSTDDDATSSYCFANKSPLLTAIGIDLLKVVLYVLLGLNILNFESNNNNKLNLPVAVDTSVIVSQFISMLLAVMMQHDIYWSVFMMVQGFGPKADNIVSQASNGKARLSSYKWWAVAVSFGLGLFGLVMIFILIVGSSTVLRALLNFAAGGFVAKLDDGAFFLAETGFFGIRHYRLANIITTLPEVEVIEEDEEEQLPLLDVDCNNKRPLPSKATKESFLTKRCSRHFLFTGISLTLLIIMFTGWALIYQQQKQGAYAANTIFVQFDDTVQPLGTHSGFYTLQTQSTIDPVQRFRYNEERNGNGTFALCRTKSSSSVFWTFILAQNDDDDSCDESLIQVRSALTDSYDVLDAARGQWFVKRTDSSATVPMNGFFLLIGCHSDSDCNDGTCGAHNNKCTCPPESFGPRCEYPSSNLCSKLALDEQFSTRFPIDRPAAADFSMMPNLSLYERPVYHNQNSGDTLLFTGLRWALLQMNNITKTHEFQNFTTTFHGSSLDHIDMMSEVTPYRSARDASPEGLQWLRNAARHQKKKQKEFQLVPASSVASLLCRLCNVTTNPCEFDNDCNEASQRCVCNNGATGTLCHIAPTHDGKCDDYFNNGEFGFDGGDCCSETCTSTAQYTCGDLSRDARLFEEPARAFPVCKDPGVRPQCKDEGRPCYIQDSVVKLVGQGWPSPVLCSNGRTLLVRNEIQNTVDVYDVSHGEWLRRGQTISGKDAVFSYFVGAEIIAPPLPIVGPRKATYPHVTYQEYIVTWKTGGPANTLQIYRWNDNSSKWELFRDLLLLNDGQHVWYDDVTKYKIDGDMHDFYGTWEVAPSGTLGEHTITILFSIAGDTYLLSTRSDDLELESQNLEPIDNNVTSTILGSLYLRHHRQSGSNRTEGLNYTSSNIFQKSSPLQVNGFLYNGVNTTKSSPMLTISIDDDTTIGNNSQSFHVAALKASSIAGTSVLVVSTRSSISGTDILLQVVGSVGPLLDFVPVDWIQKGSSHLTTMKGEILRIDTPGIGTVGVIERSLNGDILYRTFIAYRIRTTANEWTWYEAKERKARVSILQEYNRVVQQTGSWVETFQIPVSWSEDGSYLAEGDPKEGVTVYKLENRCDGAAKLRLVYYLEERSSDKYGALVWSSNGHVFYNCSSECVGVDPDIANSGALVQSYPWSVSIEEVCIPIEFVDSLVVKTTWDWVPTNNATKFEAFLIRPDGAVEGLTFSATNVTWDHPLYAEMYPFVGRVYEGPEFL